MRASDADRERVVQTLHSAVGRGLLSLEEGDQRVEVTYRTQHLDDLAPLLADLPPEHEHSPRRAPGWRSLVTLFWLQLQDWLRAGSRTTRGRRWNPRIALGVLGVVLLLALVEGGVSGIEFD